MNCYLWNVLSKIKVNIDITDMSWYYFFVLFTEICGVWKENLHVHMFILLFIVIYWPFLHITTTC